MHPPGNGCCEVDLQTNSPQFALLAEVLLSDGLINLFIGTSHRGVGTRPVITGDSQRTSSPDQHSPISFVPAGMAGSGRLLPISPPYEIDRS